jgi:transposase
VGRRQENELPYSETFKRKMVEKLCGADRISATALSDRVGVPQPTLSRWLREAKVGGMRETPKKSSSPKKKSRRPQDWSAEERLQAVSRASTLNEEELGAFLRREGLRKADLERWRRTLLEALASKAEQRSRRRRSEESKRIRELEKELRRKDKALAETAALLALKKKAQEIWGDEDDNTR